MNLSDTDIRNVVADNCGTPADPEKVKLMLDVHRWHLKHSRTNPLMLPTEEHRRSMRSIERLISYEENLLETCQGI